MKEDADSNDVGNDIIHTEHVEGVLLDFTIVIVFLVLGPEEAEVAHHTEHSVCDKDQEVSKEEISIVGLWVGVLLDHR